MEPLVILVDRLRGGEREDLHLRAAPDFLEVTEPDLSFLEEVRLDGEAYLAEDYLVIHGDLSTFVRMPCSICNEPARVAVRVCGFYHTHPVKEIKGAVFELAPLLREAILIEVPPFVECHEGHCPRRIELAPYLKVGMIGESKKDQGTQPFKDLL